MDNTKEALFRLQTNWGTIQLYPECPTARLICKLKGTKTISLLDVKILKTLGINPTLKQETLT